jgi:AcrR family transcriptional regulator
VATEKLRADARRNQERVIAAAAEVFAERGMSATVAEIAKRAGVGPATLYRRFPTKRDLLLAVVVEKLEALIAEGRAAAVEADPATGLRRFFVAASETTARDQTLLELAHDTINDPRLSELQAAIFASMSSLVIRAKAAAELRDDIQTADLAVLMNAIAYGVRGLDDTDPDAHLKYIEIVLTGLRPTRRRTPNR